MGWDGGSSPSHGCSRLAGVCQDLLHAGAWIAPGDVQRDPVFVSKLSLVTELCLGPRISHTTRCRCFRLPRRAHRVGLSQPVSISGTSVSLVPCHRRDGRTTGPQNRPSPYNPLSTATSLCCRSLPLIKGRWWLCLSCGDVDLRSLC